MSLFQIDLGADAPGGRRPSFLLTRELNEQGFPARLVVRPGSPLQAEADAAGLPTLPVRMKDGPDIGAARRLSRVMRRNGCVLAHFHGSEDVTVGSAACERAKVPIRIVSRPGAGRLRKGLFTKAARLSDVGCLIASSEAGRDALVQGGIEPDKIEVVPAGIDFGAYEAPGDKGFLRRELGFAEDDFLAGLVAHLEDAKGHRYLIEAARMLRERTSKIKLVILGRGTLELSEGALARDLGFGDVAFYLGSRDDLPRVLGSLDCYVLSSEQDEPSRPIMDAMASRLPVVATQVSGVPEVVMHDETGFLVSPRSPRALAEAIYALYHDPDLAQRFGERGYQVVNERFSSLAMARRTIALYKRIAYRRRVRLEA